VRSGIHLEINEACWGAGGDGYDALVSAGVSPSAVPGSLVWRTDVDVLPIDRVVERRDDHLVIRSPSNPTHYWGNLLLFDDPPDAGDGVRWEQQFENEFGSDPRVQHLAFGWDHVDGELGRAQEEFAVRGYVLEQTIGLVATPDLVRPHPRENRDVQVRALDPLVGVDEGLWEQVVALQGAARDDRLDEEAYRAFSRRRLVDLRALFSLGRGGWYVALEAGGAEVVASCGVVVTDARGRFQSVDTKAAYRRRGIGSRLVVEAAYRTAGQHGARHLVIAADANYHALGLYESLGFQRLERVSGVCKQPARLTAG
jgi:ribosomal protein S18 acetylase RimI-like enzyme